MKIWFAATNTTGTILKKQGLGRRNISWPKTLRTLFATLTTGLFRVAVTTTFGADRDYKKKKDGTVMQLA